MKKFDKERVLLAVAGPVIALVAAIALTSVSCCSPRARARSSRTS